MIMLKENIVSNLLGFIFVHGLVFRGCGSKMRKNIGITEKTFTSY